MASAVGPERPFLTVFMALTARLRGDEDSKMLSGGRPSCIIRISVCFG